LVGGIQVSEAVKIITGQKPALVNNLLYIDLNELSFDKVQMFRHEECPSCGSKKRADTVKVVQQQLLIEELCGRDMGKRTYTVTPSELSSPIDLMKIIENAELLGYQVKTRGSLGVTVESNISSKLSVSFLTSGAATIVGAKDEEDALYIYRNFIKDIS
jgi:adenylyltransferase/sulfurtransferase